MSKHTPGPWVAKSYGQYKEFQVESFDRQRIIASKIGGMSGEDEANAHLIASAPAMLDALRECLAVLEDDQGIYDDDPDWWGRRSDAIAKAKNALPRGTP